MKELICMIGLSGAGKSTAAKILSEKYGYEYVTSSDYVKMIRKEIFDLYNYDFDTNNLIGAISEYYAAGFNEFMSHIFINNHCSKIVWDSCVNIHHIDKVLSCFDKVYFLCMTAPHNTRILRIKKRGSYPDKTLEEVEKSTIRVDEYERMLGLGELMLLSDWFINASSFLELEKNIDEFILKCDPTSVEYKICHSKNNFDLPALPESDLMYFGKYMSSKMGERWL